MWLKESDINEVVHEGWLEGGNDVVNRLGGRASKLQCWSRRVRMKFKEDIEACRKQIELLRSRNDEDGVMRYKAAQNHMNKLISQEETFWR
ncbi:hypothetical protein A2U01_0047449 [Trifolium medium]|uniref:Uncharacterized protein n=1 Tax=Trifolium medium TaxID=97028 RepID=A0A392QR01_9FABA|nr:hypothetical protein [Trifolium medium]